MSYTPAPRFAQAKQLYTEKGIGSRVGFGSRPCFLIVDFAKGFTDPSTPVGAPLDAEVEATAAVLAAARAAGVLIVFLTTGYQPDLRDGGRFVEKVPALRCMVLGSRWVEIDDRLRPREGEPVILKKFSSGFLGTNLGSLLTSQGIDTVIIAGCSTSGCVRATAHDACSYGFRTIVARECVGDRAPEPHEANLFDIDAKYGDVVAKDEVIAYFRQLQGQETPGELARIAH
jgi:maleamate amidohydrolase